MTKRVDENDAARAPTLDLLFSAHDGNVSDKWSLYVSTYERLFAEFRDKPIRLLEIGTQNGGSLEIWGKYFANARVIIGCDVNPACATLAFDDERISLVVGDANSAEVAQQIEAASPEYDIIIDDGSHKSSDIVRSFATYFQHLSEGGIYVVEDLHCSYWGAFEGGLHHPYSSLAFFKRLLDVVNSEHWGTALRRSELLAGFANVYGVAFDDDVLASIHSIEILNSLCVVRKREAEENVLGPRRVVGRRAAVDASVMALDGSTAEKLDESGNPWATEVADPQSVLLTEAPGSTELLPQRTAVGLLVKQLAESRRLLALGGAPLERSDQQETSEAQDAASSKLHPMSVLRQEVQAVVQAADVSRQALLARSAELRAQGDKVRLLEASLLSVTDELKQTMAREAELRAEQEKAFLLAANLRALTSELEKTSAKLGETKQLVATTEVRVLRARTAADEANERAEAANAALAERDAELLRVDAERQQAAALSEDLAQKLQQKDDELRHQRQIIDGFYKSTSWRLTAPVRAVKHGLVWLRQTPARARRQAGVLARWLWRWLPLSATAKGRIKDVLFSMFPALFAGTQVFRNWTMLRELGFSSNESLLDALPASVENSVDAFVPRRPTSAPLSTPAKLICFYLPQFHPIPENDAWWGEGFTEWTNVRPAQPQFVGHYQPRVPDALGYYDLMDSEVQRRQIELAKLYGIGGFCFYLYWFGGKRLLEKPVENYLNDSSLDLPFCLCWANENWSRRWDGLDTEILMAQQHSPEDDIAFIAEVAPYLRDARYIRIGGRPLLLVYRPNLLPSAAETSARWRTWCRENGIGEIFLAYTQSFEAVDPATYGFDAAIEFPPNNSAPPLITHTVQPLRPDCQVTVYDWRVFPFRSMQYKTPDYTLFRSVCPSWDNTARRKNRGTVFLHSTPDLYRQWLENAIADTCSRFARPDERLVFVNAWNEWAEGAYLEPDARYGYAYLQATRDALEAASSVGKRVVVVAHDAHPHGAQFLSLHLARHFRKDLGFEVDLISLGEGPLLDAYAEAAVLHRMDPAADAHAEIVQRLMDLRRQGAEVAIVNTTVSGALVPHLKEAGFRVVSLIHELPGLLEDYGLKPQAEEILRYADAVVFAADAVRAGFEAFTGQRVERAKIRPQGLYLRNRVRSPDERQAVRAAVRAELGLPEDVRIVLSVGYGDHRKGLDLFVDVLTSAMRQDPTVFGVWVGHADAALLAAQRARIEEAGLADRFHFTGRVSDPQRFYSAADVFALTAREDPFPSVVLEALDAATPVAAFKGAGGFESLLKRQCGVLVEAFDTEAMAREILALLAEGPRARNLALAGQTIIDREFSLRHYLFDLLEFAGRPHPRVSVIVPNYNYAGFIEDRLRTIIEQTYPIYELIVLDDASTDDSARVIEESLRDCDIPHVFIRNAENSGSVFHQWRRGVEEARGDFVWIAEADDLSDPEFLETVIRPFDSPETVISYAQSRQMAADGSILCEHYLDYVADVDPAKWTEPYRVSGHEEISRALYVKNTVPNVSAVLFRRDALRAALEANTDEILSYRNAGDWVTYLRVLGSGGSIAFSPRALNSHRRHQQSVTVGNFNLRHLQEIVRVQRDTIRRFGLGADAQARADAYAQKLYEQFGLATAAHLRFSDHPEFKNILGSCSERGGQHTEAVR